MLTLLTLALCLTPAPTRPEEPAVPLGGSVTVYGPATTKHLKELKDSGEGRVEWDWFSFPELSGEKHLYEHLVWNTADVRLERIPVAPGTGVLRHRPSRATVVRDKDGKVVSMWLWIR